MVTSISVSVLDGDAETSLIAARYPESVHNFFLVTVHGEVVRAVVDDQIGRQAGSRWTGSQADGWETRSVMVSTGR